MKIIELLNKIANGEEVPKKIKYDNDTYYWHQEELDYYTDDRKAMKIYLFENHTTFILNDEVEIIGIPKREETEDKFSGWKMYKDGKMVYSMDCSAKVHCSEDVKQAKKIGRIITRGKTIGFPNGEWIARNMDLAFADKINELIDKVNELEEEN